MPIIRELTRGARPLLLLGSFAVAGLTSFSIVRAAIADQPVLRVCADPANLPYSNRAGQGFENALATLIGRQLEQHISYVWTERGPTALVDALNAKRCDVVLGIPSDVDTVATTQPYYWSSYVFVTRRKRGLDITSISDHRLKTVKIGVEAIDGNALATPPARLLAEKGLRGHFVAFPLATRASGGEAPQHMIDAVARGNIDVAALWGPQAGYFARSSKVPLRLTAISNTEEFSTHKDKFDLAGLQYEIAMAVRNDDPRLRDALNEFISENRPQIKRLLQSYGIPVIAPQLHARIQTANAGQ